MKMRKITSAAESSVKAAIISELKVELATSADAATQTLATAAEKATAAIATAAEKATAAIATAALAATKLVSVNAAVAAAVRAEDDKPSDRRANIDHDLLVILDTKMEGLKDDIAVLSNMTSARIGVLERDKLDAKDAYPKVYKEQVEREMADHETRIRDTEKGVTRILTWGSALVMLVGIVELAFNRLWR